MEQLPDTSSSCSVATTLLTTVRAANIGQHFLARLLVMERPHRRFPKSRPMAALVPPISEDFVD